MDRAVIVAAILAPIVAAATGCAQLAGIDDTSGKNRIGDSLRIQRMSVGATVQLSDLDLSGLQATYFVANADTPGGYDRVTATAGQAGTWAADLRAPAPVEFTLPDLPSPVPRMLSLPNQSISTLYGVLEHPNHTPAPDGATLHVQVTLDAAYPGAESYQSYCVGSWTNRGFAAAEIGAVGVTALDVTYPFASSNSLSGRPTFDQITSADAFLVLRYVGASLTGVAIFDPFDQTGTDKITSTMAPVSRMETLDVKLDPPSLATRYTAARPAVANLVMNWSLVAAPGYRIASNAGPALSSGALAMTDTGVNTTYGNPFTAKNWNTIFTLATSESRTYTPMGTTTPVTLYAGMNQFIEPSPGFALMLPAGLPELITLDGMPLSTDGQTVPTPTKFVDVSYVADNPNATLYNLQVFDLLPNMAGTALEYHFVFGAAGTETKSGTNEAVFHIPPEVFQTGHRYTLRAITTYGGYPGIATAQLDQRELPLAQGYLDSGVIQVMP